MHFYDSVVVMDKNVKQPITNLLSTPVWKT
jgi:hypothetical protein